MLRFVNLDDPDVDTQIINGAQRVDISRFGFGDTNVYTAYVSVLYVHCLPVTEALHITYPKFSVGPCTSLLDV